MWGPDHDGGHQWFQLRHDTQFMHHQISSWGARYLLCLGMAILSLPKMTKQLTADTRSTQIKRRSRHGNINWILEWPTVPRDEFLMSETTFVISVYTVEPAYTMPLSRRPALLSHQSNLSSHVAQLNSYAFRPNAPLDASGVCYATVQPSGKRFWYPLPAAETHTRHPVEVESFTCIYK